jgi:hypothetical protein
MRRITIIALAAFGPLTLAGCGGTSSATSSSSGTHNSAPAGAASLVPLKTEAAARKVIEDYNRLFISKDFKAACALLTPAYQKKTISDSSSFSDSKPPADCEQALQAAYVFAKSFGIDNLKTNITQVKVNGDTATVLDEPGAPFSNTLYTLQWSGTRWLVAKDEDAAQAGADPQKWLANWCQVKPGMTVDEAVKLMGKFTEDFRGPDQANPQVAWSKGPYGFTAFLDTDGKIIQLDTNESKLGATDKAKLTCQSTRR